MMLRRLHDDERGVALITVIGLSLVLALMVAALLQYGLGSMRQARFDQDWHGAVNAADAGVDDFLYRINRDTAYWQEADLDCTLCTGTLDPDNPALTGFTTIPGGEGQFSYEIDASDIGATGVIVVNATGRVNGVERSGRAVLRRRGFLDYLYFTEYETLDPVAYSTPANQAWAAANCTRHRYDSPSRHSSCINITWANGDAVTGPFHSNDQIAVYGSPTWTGEATTSNPDGTYLDIAPNPDRSCLGPGDPAGCSSNPSFSAGLAFNTPLVLPPSNNQIKAQADPAISGDGCMYVGATFLRFNADGTVTVKSQATDDPSASKCPINGTMSSLPSNGVIYVRAAKATETCLSSPPHPYNLTNDVTPYDQCAGDVFVEGTLDGRLTVAAENNVVIANDLIYAGGRGSGSDDMLGLVANNFVEIMHPVRSNGNDIRYLPGNRRFEDPHIDAAILSLEHSFRVQNFRDGSAFGSPIDVHGAIAQQFRGPVGTFSGSTTVSGYPKDYKYDDRLAYVSPPHFLDPVKSAWTIRSWSEE